MVKALAAGFLISIGCKVCVTIGGLFGALLFSVALLCIMQYRLPLFTGKVGYRTRIFALLYILIFNLLGAFLGGMLFKFAWELNNSL